jgi:hypothetical protein
MNIAEVKRKSNYIREIIETPCKLFKIFTLLFLNSTGAHQ